MKSLEIVQVFVSSTYLDLQPERQAVEAVLLRLRETKFVGMEYFGSRDETTRQTSLDEVDRSNVYVGIIAGRYGSGITEDEYRRARALKLPCFVYFKRESDIQPAGRDSDADKAAKLAAFRRELQRNHIITEFTSPDDLAARLTADLHNWLVKEYLTPQLAKVAEGRMPREQARELMAAIKDDSGLDRDLLSKARDVIASGAGSVGIAGDVPGGVIVTGSGAQIQIVQDRREALPFDLQFRNRIGKSSRELAEGEAGCMGAIDGPGDTHAQFSMKVPATVTIILMLILAIALYLIFGRNSDHGGDGIYRVRATVLNPQGVPVEDAKVWSSVGGEPKKVAGGWQFDIPVASKPRDGKLSVYASQETAFLKGQSDLTLANDVNQTVTIRLLRDASATVRGRVTDGRNHSVAGARVFVEGYGGESVITKEDGNFELPAHAAENQPVSVVAEKAGVGTARLWHPAGDTPVQLVLQR